ncbi:PD-(D/E)XK nuclease family protein [Halorubrum vacuolatum]|uniref:hypothetical protein n=1 Tax=Halorubrum vacuolatum TaxID=63740 RepID=UPI0011799AC8|nr:hypothetical protein [Halorubrum vacuolatum]
MTAGSIAERNLKRSLVAAGVPASQAAGYSSIEEIARTVLSAHHGSRAALVDGALRQRAIVEIVSAATCEDPETELERFVSRIEWDEDAYARLTKELEEYFRASNVGAADEAARDHGSIAAVAEELSDPFAAWKSSQGVAAFGEIHGVLQERMQALPSHVYLSRSHLVAAACDHLAAEWEAVFPTIDWVGVATVNVFDNPTIRLLEALDDLPGGPTVTVFGRSGTREDLVARMTAIGMDVREVTARQPELSEAAADVLAVAHNEFEGLAPASGVELIEAPDHRREVEAVAARLRELFADGVVPEDVVVVARDAGAYRSVVEDVFTTNEFPYHIETRVPMANVPAYRFVKATIDVIAATSTAPDGAVGYEAVIDPLRLGLCVPRADVGSWPVPQAEFLRLEEELAAAEDTSGPRSLAEWETFAVERAGPEWEIMSAYVAWIREQADLTVTDGAWLRAWIQRLLQRHIEETVGADVESPAGPMVDPSRGDLSSKHESHYARRVQDQAGRVHAYVDRARAMTPEADSGAGWELAARAVGDVMGGESIGTRSADASAVRVVDAGNTYFLDAEHVFILGVSAETFPHSFTPPTFLHEDLFDAVHDVAHDRVDASGGDVDPHVFYESRQSQYNQDLDLYEAAAGTSAESVTVLHNYLDSASDPVAWSSFVDYLDPDATEDAYVSRIAVDDWLPISGAAGEASSAGDGGDDVSKHGVASAWSELAGRDRLRAYAFHAADADHVSGPSISPVGLTRLALWTDGSAYHETIRPRIDRLTTPTFRITVGESDAAFAGSLSPASLTGDPVRTYEADLYAQCELKYYFYQYLFNRDGDTIDRGRIPESRRANPTSRFGRVPRVLREQHVTERYQAAIRAVIEELAPDRQADLGSFSDPSEVIAWWRENAPASAPQSIAQSLIREYKRVQSELAADVSRDWEWVTERTITVGDVSLELGAHRVDTVRFHSSDAATADEETVDAYQLPVFYVAERGAAAYAPKLCWEPPREGAMQPQECREVCRQCEKSTWCRIGSKFDLDHRLHGTALGYDAPLGAVFVEQGVSGPSGRDGYLIDQPGTDDGLAAVEQTGRTMSPTTWERLAESWRTDLSAHLESMQGEANEPSVYHVDREFVAAGTDRYGNHTDSGDNGCATCVYQDLCQLPQQVNER